MCFPTAEAWWVGEGCVWVAWKRKKRASHLAMQVDLHRQLAMILPATLYLYTCVCNVQTVTTTGGRTSLNEVVNFPPNYPYM